MLRTLIWFAYLWASLLGSVPNMRKALKHQGAGDMDKRDEIVNSVIGPWARRLIEMSGTEVQVKGIENIPDQSPVLFVGNHQSNFDIPLLLGYIDKPKAFIAKIELKKMPLISSWMELMECVFMDRSDIRQSAKAIGQGAKNLKAGYSMVVFPEGTRTEDGILLDFKPGALKLATKSGVEIIPVTINGSKDIMTKGSRLIRPAKVEIIISEPIPMNDEWKKDTIALADQIRGIIAKNLGQQA